MIAIVYCSGAGHTARLAELIAEGANAEGMDTVLVDAAAIVGHFERLVRVADATGIPLDAAAKDATTDIREALGHNAYAMASRTLGEDGA